MRILGFEEAGEQNTFTNKEGEKFKEGVWYVRTDSVLDIIKVLSDHEQWLQMQRPQQIQEIKPTYSDGEVEILTKNGTKTRIMLDNIRIATSGDIKKDQLQTKFNPKKKSTP